MEGKLIHAFEGPQEMYSLDQKGLFVTRAFKDGEVFSGKLLIH